MTTTIPTYTTNLKRGDNGSEVYWRTLWALKVDPIASMLNDDVLKGLANAYRDGMTDDENKARFSRDGARYFAKNLIEHTPLSILGDKAKAHLASVILKGVFPEDQS